MCAEGRRTSRQRAQRKCARSTRHVGRPSTVGRPSSTIARRRQSSVVGNRPSVVHLWRRSQPRHATNISDATSPWASVRLCVHLGVPQERSGNWPRGATRGARRFGLKELRTLQSPWRAEQGGSGNTAQRQTYMAGFGFKELRVGWKYVPPAFFDARANQSSLGPPRVPPNTPNKYLEALN